jgi:hypothetical protein
VTHQETRMRLADIWEHLNECYRQWEQADEDGAEWLTSCLVRDLDECLRLCESFEPAFCGESSERHGHTTEPCSLSH